MIIEPEILLQHGAVIKPVSTNDVIIREEQPAWSYHQLINGSAKAININEHGKEYLQYIIDPGESFGEIPIFDGGNYAITVVATEPGTIIKLPLENFKRLLEEDRELYPKYMKLLCERLRFKYFLLKETANHNPEKSIINLINYFKGTKKICEKCNKLNLTRQQIADMLGLRVETVIRSIRNLHLNGRLEIRRGKVFCYD